jgi:hypothetical protein
MREHHGGTLDDFFLAHEVYGGDHGDDAPLPLQQVE